MWKYLVMHTIACTRFDFFNVELQIQLGHYFLLMIGISLEVLQAPPPKRGLSAGYRWGLSAGYQPRPQVVDRGTTARYGGQLRYI